MAFEFSRRKMLEVDKIVTTMMEKLASLRKITEKSASLQVKKVFRNALKFDQSTKSRMYHQIREATKSYSYMQILGKKCW